MGSSYSLLLSFFAPRTWATQVRTARARAAARRRAAERAERVVDADTEMVSTRSGAQGVEVAMTA